MILTTEQLHQISEKYWRPMGTLATSEVRDMFDTIAELTAKLDAVRESCKLGLYIASGNFTGDLDAAKKTILAAILDAPTKPKEARNGEE